MSISDFLNFHGEKKFRWITLAIVSFLAYFLVFYRLDALSLRTWDESLFAFRAFYFAENGKFLVAYRDIPGLPALMNTKPPLFTIIQAFSFKIFGYTELALRLPVAVSVVILAGGIIHFVEKETGSFITGVFAGLILLTSPGFMEVHVARTGDQDAPFVMLMFFSFVFFYRYLERNNQKNILYATFFIIAACLVKSISGLFLLPSFLIFVLIEKKLRDLLRSPYFWISSLLFILMVPGFYYIMDLKYPGFFKVAWQHDMFGRYTETIDRQSHGFIYYMKTLIHNDFRYWLIFLIPGILMPNFFSLKYDLKKVSNYSLLLSLQILLVISFSKTKTEWYDALMFPWLAIISGTGIFSLSHFFKLKKEFWKRYIYCYIVITLIFFFPVKEQIKRNSETKDNWPPFQYGYTMKYLKKNNPGIKKFSVIYHSWNLPLVFYANVYNVQYDYNIKICDSVDEITSGDTLLICEPELKEKMKVNHDFSVILSHRKCDLIRVK